MKLLRMALQGVLCLLLGTILGVGLLALTVWYVLYLVGGEDEPICYRDVG